jgi:hypothetical protein
VGVPATVPVGERFVTNCSWKQVTVAVAVHVVVSVIVNVYVKGSPAGDVVPKFTGVLGNVQESH